PHESIPQQEPFTDAFWTQKNAEYLAKLKASKVKNGQGKESSAYDKRVEEMRPIWQQVLKETDSRLAEAKSKMEAAKGRLGSARGRSPAWSRRRHCIGPSSGCGGAGSTAGCPRRSAS